jgi:hypothetical protein
MLGHFRFPKKHIYVSLFPVTEIESYAKRFNAQCRPTVTGPSEAQLYTDPVLIHSYDKNCKSVLCLTLRMRVTLQCLFTTNYIKCLRILSQFKSI